MTHNDHKFKEKKLSNFTEVYYRSSHKSKKINSLPYWMNTYGYWLDKEDNQKLPRYYREFRPGTVVTVDFGVRVGSEMSLGHFAVVLSAHDDKYKKNIIVVPLSSKQHKNQNYLPLGRELFKGAARHFLAKTIGLSTRLKALKDNLIDPNGTADITISKIESDLLDEHNIDLVSVLDTDEIELDDYKHTDFYRLIQRIKAIDNPTLYPNLHAFVISAEKEFAWAEELNTQYLELVDYRNSLLHLTEKVKRYNKDTFADVGNIQTVSKLRVKKFSSFNISENVIFDQNLMAKIKDRLNDFI